MKKIYYLVLISLLLIVSSCTSNKNNISPVKNPDAKVTIKEIANKEDNFEYNVIKNISPEEAKKELDKDQSIVLLDVRTQKEYNEIHIPCSKLIPLDKLQKNVEKEINNKNTKIFIYCKSGGRSKAATELLENLGYKNAYNLGGINNWPYETEQSK